MEPPEEAWRGSPRSGLMLPEGVEAGLLGGLAAAGVLYAYDAARGAPLATPAWLGTLLVEGSSAVLRGEPLAGAAALFHALHFFYWLAVGFAASELCGLAERRPARRRLLLLPVAAVLAPALAVEAAVRGSPLATGPMWLGGLGGIAAAGAFLAWRHPDALVRRPA